MQGQKALPMQGQKTLGFHQMYLNLCSEDEQIPLRKVYSKRNKNSHNVFIKLKYHFHSILKITPLSFFLSGGLGEHNPSKKRGSLYLLLDRIRRLGFGKFKTLDCFSAFFLIYPTAPLGKPQVPLHQHLELALKLALFTLSILSIHLDQLIIYIIENDSSMCMFLFMYFFRAQYFITHNSIIW